jgi:DNA polymerase IV
LSLDDLTAELNPLVDKVWRYCDGTGARGRTVTLKVKYADFQVITRSRSAGAWVAGRSELAMIAEDLLTALAPLTKGVRLLGVSVSSLSSDEADDDPQMALAL